MILSDDSVRCWGNNAQGQLGHGNVLAFGDDEVASAAPPVALLAKPQWIGGGRFHTCALLQGGRVQCWGAGGLGQLGYGNTDNIGDDEPADAGGFVDLGGEVQQLAVGGSHNCALLTSGSVRCWGLSMRGELGYGNTISVGDDELPAAAGDVPLGFVPTGIWAGYFRSCAWNDQTVACWGGNTSGQLGRGNVADIGDDEPASAGTLDLGFAPSTIGGGVGHTCAAGGAGELRCWGIGGDGQLGTGARDNLGDDEVAGSGPLISLASPAVAVAAGQQHSCAVQQSGGVRCWGSSEDGQLGRGDTLSHDSAEGVGDIELGLQASQISCGLRFCCATDGAAVRCWGGSPGGELGAGNTDSIGDDEPATGGLLLRF